MLRHAAMMGESLIVTTGDDQVSTNVSEAASRIRVPRASGGSCGTSLVGNRAIIHDEGSSHGVQRTLNLIDARPVQELHHRS